MEGAQAFLPTLNGDRKNRDTKGGSGLNQEVVKGRVAGDG